MKPFFKNYIYYLIIAVALIVFVLFNNCKSETLNILLPALSVLFLLGTLIEQIKANKQTREQQSFQYVSEQFNRLEDRHNVIIDSYKKIKNDIAYVRSPMENDYTSNRKSVDLCISSTNEILYTITLFKDLKKAIDLKQNDKENLLDKLKLLYNIKYKDSFCQLIKILSEEYTDIDLFPKEDIQKLISEINDLENALNF